MRLSFNLAARQLMVLSIVEEDVGLHRNGADYCANFLSKEDDHVVRWGCLGDSWFNRPRGGGGGSDFTW